MNKLIYDTFEMLNTEDAKKELQDINDVEITEEDINEFLYKEYESCFNDEVDNLNYALNGRVLAIASLGLWNGRTCGYKVGEANLNEIMYLGNEDMFKIYAELQNIKKISYHHDGTNHILFREIREERNIEVLLNKIYNGEDVTNNMLNYYTRSLYPYVKNIYGW